MILNIIRQIQTALHCSMPNLNNFFAVHTYRKQVTPTAARASNMTIVVVPELGKHIIRYIVPTCSILRMLSICFPFCIKGEKW